MTTYFINFADPLRNLFPTSAPYGARDFAFSIPPGGFNGPGGSVSSSNLRLYGRGALEWGEAVDEDLLRLAENFSGSTPPPFAVGGQVWLQTKFYIKLPAAWYRFDIETSTPGSSVWQTLAHVVSPGAAVGGVSGGVAAGTGSNVPPTNPPVGSYWYTAGGPVGNDAFGLPLKANTLYRYDLPYKQMPAGWIERTHTITSVAPTGTTNPERDLMCWDEFAQAWGAAPVAQLSPTTPSTNVVGGIWFNTTVNQPFMYNGTTWDQLITASFAGGATGYVQKTGDTMSGILNMGTNRITNVDTPIAAGDAVNLLYANSTYVNTAGDTMTGPLFLPINLAPAANEAVTASYVTTVALAGVPQVRVPPYVGGYNIGDIYVDSGVIYIAVSAGAGAPPGGGWRQVFPAQYS